MLAKDRRKRDLPPCQWWQYVHFHFSLSCTLMRCCVSGCYPFLSLESEMATKAGTSIGPQSLHLSGRKSKYFLWTHGETRPKEQM